MCVKRCFADRRSAKRFLRRIEGSGTVDRRMHVYRCPHGCGGFHLGHMPTAVKRGAMPRAQAK